MVPIQKRGTYTDVTCHFGIPQPGQLRMLTVKKERIWQIARVLIINSDI